MKQTLLTSLWLGGALCARGALVEFDLSPPGTGPGVGLSPLNEIIPGASGGSGGELDLGIVFDTASGVLRLNLGYGSAAGFADLTAPAFSWFLHGPAPRGETAPVLFDLAPLHAFAANPAQGGRITGTLTFNTAQAADLLAGLDYINIYTPTHLGGEIRGQLVVVPEPNALALLLVSATVVFVRMRPPWRR